MIIKCKDCGKEVEIEEKDAKWKNKCRECFIKTKEKEKEYFASKKQKEEDATQLNIRFGGCLNASGSALAGTGTTPELHFAYAKTLYQLWNTKDDKPQEYAPEEEVKDGNKT